LTQDTPQFFVAPASRRRFSASPHFAKTAAGRRRHENLHALKVGEQGWPGRAILEYDSGIPGCEGCGPNFDFI